MNQLQKVIDKNSYLVWFWKQCRILDDIYDVLQFRIWYVWILGHWEKIDTLILHIIEFDSF